MSGRKEVHVRQPQGAVRHDLRARESLEVVLIAATFDQDVSLAFLDDGVYQLDQGPGHQAASASRTSRRPIRALDGYDVEKLYVERESMEARGLTEDDDLTASPVEGCWIVSSDEMAELMERAGRDPELLRKTDADAAHRQQITHRDATRWRAACAWRRQGSAVLLIEDGVYAAQKHRARPSPARRGARASCKVYALQPDLDARGMHADQVIDGITAVDYGGFVDLPPNTTTCSPGL